jgi:hypothetical protein
VMGQISKIKEGGPLAKAILPPTPTANSMA